MTDRFLKIAITKPEIISSEADMISSLLVNGLDYVHIRKPEASLRDIRNLIEDIPYRLRKRLRLHGHFELFNDFNLGGAHLNSRCPVAPQAACRLSKSCHSIEELNGCEDYEYVTLSPIFDSISKAGYHSAFDINDLKDKIYSKRYSFRRCHTRKIRTTCSCRFRRSGNARMYMGRHRQFFAKNK